MINPNAISKKSFHLFKSPTIKTKQLSKIKNLKGDVALFSKLYIVAKDGESDLQKKMSSMKTSSIHLTV